MFVNESGRNEQILIKDLP